MRYLIHGILDFRRRFLPQLVDTFKKLDEGQYPDCLFVACSDSRVVPNLFASTNPGEMFVVRNVGNLIPPPLHQSKDQIHNKEGKEEIKKPEGSQFIDSTGAALEFSTMVLGVQNIVVCGHSKCGAMNKFHACKGDTSGMAKDTPYISGWLNNISTSLEKLNKYKETKEPIRFKGLADDGDIFAHIDIENLSDADQLSQVNVLQQLEHIAQYGVVSERVLKKELILHGWWFNIGKAEVWAFSDRKQRFLLLDEERAEILLEKISQVEQGNVSTIPPPWVAGIRKKKEEKGNE